MTHKVRFSNIKYTDTFSPNQILTVKEVIHHPWHETFMFEEVDGEYSTIFFEDVLEENYNLDEWLKEPIQQRKREDLEEYRMKLKEDYLKDREEYDPWVFLSSWNIETGCGNSVSILMTQALPSEPEDHNNSENIYEITTTKEYRAERKFRQIFGDYDSNFLEFHTREEFFEKWSSYIPKALLTVKDEPCYIEFFMRLHYNFS